MFTALAVVCLIEAKTFTSCQLLNSPANGYSIAYDTEEGCDFAYDVLQDMMRPNGELADWYIADFRCIEWNPKLPPDAV